MTPRFQSEMQHQAVFRLGTKQTADRLAWIQLAIWKRITPHRLPLARIDTGMTGPRAAGPVRASGYQAVEKPLGQAKWGFGEQAAAPTPQSARHFSPIRLRLSHRLAR